jgi:hypothetical protein
MAVKSNTAFSLHQIMLDEIASLSRPQPPFEAHTDTAATGNFLPIGYKGKILAKEEIKVICANGATMRSIATQELDLPSLPASAKKAHIFKEMDKALLSVPELVDTDCSVNFNIKRSVVVVDNNTQQSNIKRTKRSGNQIMVNSFQTIRVFVGIFY